MTSFRFGINLGIFLGFCAAAHAGIIISRTDAGLQFTDAAAVIVNGKDKALVLGAQPKLTGPIGKLKDVKLGGSLVKDVEANTIALYQPEGIEYLLPENLPKTAPPDPAGIWRTAKIAYKKAANDKVPTDAPVEGFVAFLAGGPEELTRFCMDERALELAGGKGKTFATQLEWIAAVVKFYAANPAMAPLEKYLERGMRSRYQQFEAGTAGMDVLERALKLAELSQVLYPNQPEQARWRKALTERKEWLDRKVAVLRAFAAAEEWDALLLGGRDFERYQQAYPETIERHTNALKQSLALHREAGERHLKEGEYGPAWREFRMASMRQPSDDVLRQKVLIAWTDYSRQTAIDEQKNRKQTSAGDRNAINSALSYAEGYIKQNKLDQALKSVLEAERIDANSLPALLRKAEILGAQREFTQALAVLDRYERLAVDEERKRSEELRSDLSFKRTSALEDIKAQTQRVWNELRFHKLLDLAREGLRGTDDDADLLYQAGIASLAARDVKQGRVYLSRYLEVSNTLDADSAQRARVRTVLATTANESAAVEQGDVNWLSGKKLPKGIYYDPISLAFQPRVDRIEASNKLHVAYEWEGDKLKAIVPTFEKNDRVTGEKKISFGYEDRVPQVAVVTTEDAPAVQAADPDERFKRAGLVVLNNPYVDPVAVEKLTGKNVTLGVAGNRFFNPFIWEKVCYFRLVYDEEGRVAQAREISDGSGGAAGVLVEFDWQGAQLVAVRGYQGADRRAPKVYERTMQYQDGRLVSEDIRSQGKDSRIKYIYNAGRLVSAECGNDPLETRSRKVAFLANSPTTLVK